MDSDPLALAPTESTEKPPRQRQRAPRRSGHRAQLTVPDAMWDQVTGIARAASTTPNDVLVHLVAERLEDRRRALALRKRADERWRAFTEASTATARAQTKPLSEEELVELSQAFRADPEG
jgi:predicted DNA-binding ribbon-helix-helix protein